MTPIRFRAVRPQWSTACLVLSLVTTAFLASCSCSEEPEAVAPSPAQETTKPPTRTIPAPAPRVAPAAKALEEQLQSTVELPEGYPQDALVYGEVGPNEALVRKGRMVAIFHSEDAFDEVVEEVTGNMADQGWELVDSQDEVPNAAIVRGLKGHRSIMVTITPAKKGTADVTLIVVAVEPE